MILPNKLKKECVFELTANPETLVLIFPQKIMSGTYTIYPLDSVVNTNNKIFCLAFSLFVFFSFLRNGVKMGFLIFPLEVEGRGYYFFLILTTFSITQR